MGWNEEILSLMKVGTPVRVGDLVETLKDLHPRMEPTTVYSHIHYALNIAEKYRMVDKIRESKTVTYWVRIA